MHKTKIDEDGFAHLLVLLMILVVLIGGVGVYVAKHNTKKGVNSETVATQNVSELKPLPTDLNGVLTEDKVKQIAVENKPGAVVAKVGLVQSSNGLVFHVELEDGSALNIDAKTGTEVETKDVTNDSEGTKIAANFVPSIDFVMAKEVALTKVPNGIVGRIELEVEEGVSVYKVVFTNGTKVEVSATDGTIARVRTSNNPNKSSSTSDNKVIDVKKSDSTHSGEDSHSTSSSSRSSEDTSHSGSTSSTSHPDSSPSVSDSSGSGSPSGGHGSDDTLGGSGGHH